MLLVVMGGDTDGDTGHCFRQLLGCAGDCTRPAVSGVHSQRPSWGQWLLGQGVHSSSRAVAERRQEAGPHLCPHTFYSKAPSSPRPGPLRTSCMCCGARTRRGGRQTGVSFVGGWFVYVPVPICPEEFTQLLTSFPGGSRHLCRGHAWAMPCWRMSSPPGLTSDT